MSSDALSGEMLPQISPLAEVDVAVQRVNPNPNRYWGGEFSLSESFEFVHNTLSSSDIGNHSIGQLEGGQDSDVQAPDQWTRMYMKIVDDIKCALATALVPVIHTQVRSQAAQANARRSEGMSRSSCEAPTFCTSRSPVSSMNTAGDDEDRSTESPKRWEESEMPSCCSHWTTSYIPNSLIIRGEDIPDIDGREVVITRRKELKARPDPFVAEFYRTSVAPLFE